jgi:hypothetical protein
MAKRRNPDDEEISNTAIAGALLWIGTGCLTYRLVPYYGATPIAMGAFLLVWAAAVRLVKGKR